MRSAIRRTVGRDVAVRAAPVGYGGLGERFSKLTIRILAGRAPLAAEPAPGSRAQCHTALVDIAQTSR